MCRCPDQRQHILTASGMHQCTFLAVGGAGILHTWNYVQKSLKILRKFVYSIFVYSVGLFYFGLCTDRVTLMFH